MVQQSSASPDDAEGGGPRSPLQRIARSSHAARGALALGACIGVVEASLALRSIGPLVDRLGTMAITIAVDAAAFGLLAVVFAGVRMVTRRGTEAEAAPAPPDRRPSWIGLAACAAGLLIAVTGASNPDPNHGQNAPERPNIVLISIDTLRADHLSAYGYDRKTSPRLDAFAREGVLFVDATSHSTWTLPAHVSMFTGQNPAAHGVLAREDRIQPFHHTLAERLREAGFETSAWVGTRDWGFVGARYGFAAGFDRFLHYPHAQRFRSARLLRAFDAWWLQHVGDGVGNATAQVTNAINWIARDREAPYFAFLHFYDVHSKEARLLYEAPPPFREMFCEGSVDEVDLCDEGVCASERLLDIANGWKRPLDAEEIEWARCLYDGSIAFVDHEVGRLLDALEQLGPRDDTIVIVTSDHGEGFFEHEYPLHSTLHQEVTRIPLIIRAKGAVPGKRATGVVSQSDLLPTLLDLAGLPIEGEIQGRSLLRRLREGAVVPDVVPDIAPDEEALAFDDGFGGVLLRTGTTTLIQHPAARMLRGAPEQEYYDLASDPLQQRNRARSEKRSVAQLQVRLAQALRESDAMRRRQEEGTSRVGVEISAEAAAGLRALGYVVDDAMVDDATDDTGDDLSDENEARDEDERGLLE